MLTLGLSRFCRYPFTNTFTPVPVTHRRQNCLQKDHAASVSIYFPLLQQMESLELHYPLRNYTRVTALRSHSFKSPYRSTPSRPGPAAAVFLVSLVHCILGTLGSFLGPSLCLLVMEAKGCHHSRLVASEGGCVMASYHGTRMQRR